MRNKLGFTGMSADAYFTKVHNTIQSAENALGNGQEMIHSASTTEEQNKNYSKIEFIPESYENNIIDMVCADEFIPGSYISEYERSVDKLRYSLSAEATSSDDDLY